MSAFLGRCNVKASSSSASTWGLQRCHPHTQLQLPSKCPRELASASPGVSTTAKAPCPSFMKWLCAPHRNTNLPHGS